MNDMDVGFISELTFLLFLYLILALFVERFLEVCVSSFNYLDLKFGWHKMWNGLARRIQRQYSSQIAGNPSKQKIIAWLFWKIMAHPDRYNGREIISSALIKVYAIRAGTRILGFLISLSLILFIHFGLGIDLLDIVEEITTADLFVDAVSNNTFLQIVLSAAAVSIGSEPLHLLISRIGKPERDESPSTN